MFFGEPRRTVYALSTCSSRDDCLVKRGIRSYLAATGMIVLVRIRLEWKHVLPWTWHLLSCVLNVLWRSKLVKILNFDNFLSRLLAPRCRNKFMGTCRQLDPLLASTDMGQARALESYPSMKGHGLNVLLRIYDLFQYRAGFFPLLRPIGDGHGKMLWKISLHARLLLRVSFSIGSIVLAFNRTRNNIVCSQTLHHQSSPKHSVDISKHILLKRILFQKLIGLTSHQTHGYPWEHLRLRNTIGYCEELGRMCPCMIGFLFMSTKTLP